MEIFTNPEFDGRGGRRPASQLERLAIVPAASFAAELQLDSDRHDVGDGGEVASCAAVTHCATPPRHYATTHAPSPKHDH